MRPKRKADKHRERRKNIHRSCKTVHIRYLYSRGNSPVSQICTFSSEKPNFAERFYAQIIYKNTFARPTSLRANREGIRKIIGYYIQLFLTACSFLVRRFVQDGRILAALGRSAKAGFSGEIAAHHSFKRLMSPELATPPLTGGARQGNRTYSGFAEARKGTRI